MRGRFGSVVWSVGVAAVLWLARQVIGLSDPAHYDPATVLDCSAAWMTSIAGVATAMIATAIAEGASFFASVDVWNATSGLPYIWILVAGVMMLRRPDRCTGQVSS